MQLKLWEPGVNDRTYAPTLVCVNDGGHAAGTKDFRVVDPNNVELPIMVDRSERTAARRGNTP